ncbi:MAG TPA: hypothetical protein VF214_02820 [Edaphobacter sp.]
MPDAMIDANNDPADNHTCRYIHSENGRRCGSPARRGEPFCYHHDQEHPRPANPGERQRRRNTFDLAAPDTPTAIQDALGSIFLRIAQNEIDLRRAGLLLYTLQIASTNLATAQKEQKEQNEQEKENEQSPSATSPTNPSNQSDRAAIQQALGELFPRIDDHRLDPRRAGLLLYCLQIASANLKSQQPHETRRVPHPSHVLCMKSGKNTASTTPPESNIPGQTTEGAQGFSPAKNPPSARSFSPGPLAGCPTHVAVQVSQSLPRASQEVSILRPGTSQDNHGRQSAQREVRESQTTEPNPIGEDPIKGHPISRSAFAALLETLARRQGIDVEKVHEAHEATILLRLYGSEERREHGPSGEERREHRLSGEERREHGPSGERREHGPSGP